FDVSTGRLVDSGAADGLFQPTARGADRGKQVAAASGSFSRVPAFPRATIGDALGMRDELRTALVRFRAAIIELASAIESRAGSPGFEEGCLCDFLGQDNRAAGCVVGKSENAGIFGPRQTKYFDRRAGKR